VLAIGAGAALSQIAYQIHARHNVSCSTFSAMPASSRRGVPKVPSFLDDVMIDHGRVNRRDSRHGWYWQSDQVAQLAIAAPVETPEAGGWCAAGDK
jgi:hypothetical protein